MGDDDGALSLHQDQADREPDFVKLIAYADAMLVEKERETQERYDAAHPEYEGRIQASEPLVSAARTYRYWRVRWSDDLDLPNAMTALRPPITPITSGESGG